jgi:hypothetical protein
MADNEYISIDVNTVNLQQLADAFKVLSTKAIYTKKGMAASARYMQGEWRDRVLNSRNDKGQWEGIRLSSFLKSNRSKKAKGKYKEKNLKERLPVSFARPLITKGGAAARTTIRYDNISAQISPVMRGDGKVKTILVYHNRPEITGHPRTGKPPSPTPDRSMAYYDDKNVINISRLVMRNYSDNVEDTIEKFVRKTII